MKADEREDKAFQVLDEVIEFLQPFRIFTVLNLHIGADFGCLGKKIMGRNIYMYRKGNMDFAKTHFEFLATDFVWNRPVFVVFFQNFTLFNNSFELFKDALGCIHYVG